MPHLSRFLVIATIAVPVVGLLGGPAHAGASAACSTVGQTVTCRYEFTGAEQQFVVPAGVTQVAVAAVGGRGGGDFGGAAAHNQRTVSVAAGQVLYVEVGGAGEDSGSAGGQLQSPPGDGGWNGGARGGKGEFFPDFVEDQPGGAGGGGASDVRLTTRSTPASLNTRLLVAAGGGGQAAHFGEVGRGGDAGQAGGGDGTPPFEATPGGAGTRTGGGAAGQTEGLRAYPGQYGEGGKGASAANISAAQAGGGGGGGGVFGGGGGGSSTYHPAGGGGGSSFPVATATVVPDSPAYVTIRYTTP